MDILDYFLIAALILLFSLYGYQNICLRHNWEGVRLCKDRRKVLTKNAGLMSVMYPNPYQTEIVLKCTKCGKHMRVYSRRTIKTLTNA